jgi:mannose-6-phosphate isomerase-like protein (cupin superfamily)
VEKTEVADYKAVRIADIEAIYGGGFRRARAALGVEAFGMQVIELPPDFDDYPEHDHSEGRQEEVYLALRGSGEIEVDGETTPLDTETFVRVGPTARRKVRSGPEGLRLLAIGGVPGQPYEAPEVTKLGAPDPMAS